MNDRQTANVEIKKVNRSNIYNLIRNDYGLSRQDIVVKLRLSLPTVTQNLTEMMEEGLIFESGMAGNTGGRSAKVYSAVKDARIAIGLDVTKNYVSLVAVNLHGEIVCQRKAKMPFERSDAYYKKLGDIVIEAVGSCPHEADRILGIGLGVPALINREGDKIHYCKVLDLNNALLDEIARYMPFPTKLIHDAGAAGFAETWTSKNVENLFYLMLNNSIGGALIIDGEVFEGGNCRSAEIGHVRIVPHGKKCYCGGEGCMDPYCSAENLSILSDGSLKQFFDQLKEGNPKFQAVWKDYLYYLASAIINVRMLIDGPIVLGGYVGEYIKPFIDELRVIVADMDPFQDKCDYLHTCNYKNEVVAVGAALTFIDEFLNSI